MLYTTTLTGPLGPMMLAGTETHLTGLWLAGQMHYAAHLPPDAPRRADLALFARAEHWLNRYFAGDAPSPAELPLAPEGSEFQKRVWALLLTIPYGQTTTYGALARAISAQTGRPMAGQAVGGAAARGVFPAGAGMSRRWAARWAATPFPSSSPATGWWGQTAA